MNDAKWIASLMRHGLLQPGFIPDHQQRELRDSTCYRQSLVQEPSRFANYLQKELEGTYPYLQLDAVYLKARQSHRIVSEVDLLAIGARHAGESGLIHRRD